MICWFTITSWRRRFVNPRYAVRQVLGAFQNATGRPDLDALFTALANLRGVPWRLTTLNPAGLDVKCDLRRCEKWFVKQNPEKHVHTVLGAFAASNEPLP